MHATKQSGFGVVAIIVVILVVVGLGYIGYRVYTANINQTGNTTQNSNAQNNGTQDTATYLDIKELGAKIKLSDGIKDAVYGAVSTDDNGSKAVGISAQSLIDKSNMCAPENHTLGLVEATKVAPTYVGGSEPLPVDSKTLFKLGDTYYFYHPPQNQACLTTTQADSDLITDKINAFKEAFRTIQLDN